MKRAAWFVLALIIGLILSALPVYAQPLPFALPSCLPAEIGGAGKGLTSRKFASGVCRAGWWCQQPDGTWSAYTHCTLAEFVKDTVPLPLAASSPASAINAAITDGQVTPPANRVDAYNALHLEMRAAMLATKPASAAWVVDAATSADGTRPAFALVNGVRAETSTARAKSGQPCKPDVAQSPSLVAGKVFAAYGPTFDARMVALCRKAP